MAQGTDPQPPPWYGQFLTAQLQRHRQKPRPRSRQEIMADLNTAIDRSPNGPISTPTPTTGAQINIFGQAPIIQGVGPPRRPTVMPTATGQGGSLPPTRLQNPMIQAYLNMLMRKRTR